MKRVLTYCIGFIASLSMTPHKLKDILLWPIATRIFGKNYAQEVFLKDGFSMYGSMKDILSRKILFLGPFLENLWEPSTSILLKQLSVSSKGIIIAGSHIGYLVLQSAQETQGTVYAFEPIQDLYDTSLQNIRLNSVLEKRIILTQSALGDRDGEIQLYSEDIRSSAIPYSGGHIKHQNVVVCPITTIDTFVNKNAISKIDLILLDVEGFELNVLQGAQEVLKSNPDLILEVSPRVLAHTAITPTEFVSHIMDMGYTLYFIDDYAREYSLVLYSENTKEEFFTRDYVNIYATKK